MNQPFFIIGTQRGGTTFLRLMLNMHSQLAIPPESHFILPLLDTFAVDTQLNQQSVTEAISIIEKHPRFKTWSLTPNDFEILKNEMNYPITLSRLIDSVYKMQIKNTGKLRWGEKTPEYIAIIDGLQRLFPEGTFLVLTRDGRDVALSLKNRGWQGWSVFQRAKYWQNCMRNMWELENSKAALFIRYEDMVVNTPEILAKICSFLKIDFEPVMLDFNLSYQNNITLKEMESGVHKKLSRKPRPEDVQRWKTQSSFFDVWAFECVAYKQLMLGGYALAYFNHKNIVHQILRLTYMLWGNISVGVYKTYHSIVPLSMKKRIRSLRVGRR